MYKTRLGRCGDGGKVQPGYVETDPSGRYGRYREILGKGATKIVYRAFDEVLGMEVAWNQIKLNDVFRSPEELQRLYSEVHLLKTLRHDSIIRFYTSWIDPTRRTFNFITEMFTSGTLREYRQKYQHVDIRAVKNWARQILHGIAYLHGLDPPVIHRDLKCDNIFVNGHLGQVKIGDLGLAAVLRGSKHAHSVIGTPEFMAPELYEEEYNELADIYSFGMCVLEMLTSEYPYSECSNPAQIYKKVTSGKLPEAFYRIQDEEAKRFVGLCLQNVSKRLPAKELLLDPFLACDDDEGELLSSPKVTIEEPLQNGATAMEESSMVSDIEKSANMTITGTMDPEDDTIFLKVQISNKDGNDCRNIYFPFDILNDTAIDVATEMVKELEISDWKPSEIAQMIEKEISSLVPSWKAWGGSPRELNDHQHSFSFEDEDEDEDDNDDIVHHPFFSSCSSSHTSLPGLNFPHFHSGNKMNSCSNWLQDDDPYINDDASSQCSMNSFNYSNINYCSVHEDDYDSSLRGPGDSFSTAMPQKSTRFCPTETLNITANHYNNHYKSHKETQRAYGIKHHQPTKLCRIQSFVDLRSQLLHRSLLEEIHKRRLFKTVGSVENIGFQEI